MGAMAFGGQNFLVVFTLCSPLFCSHQDGASCNSLGLAEGCPLWRSPVRLPVLGGPGA